MKKQASKKTTEYTHSRPRLSEKDLQAQIQQALMMLGYLTMEIGAARAQVTLTCSKCKSAVTGYPTGWQGNAEGAPDLLAFRMTPGWLSIMIPLEVKGENTQVRPAQRRLANAGRVFIVRSVADAVRAVLVVEKSLTAYCADGDHVARLERFLAVNGYSDLGPVTDAP